VLKQAKLNLVHFKYRMVR